jgi:hypothetical protein
VAGRADEEVVEGQQPLAVVEIPDGEGLRGPRGCRWKTSWLATSPGLQRGPSETGVGKLGESRRVLDTGGARDVKL